MASATLAASGRLPESTRPGHLPFGTFGSEGGVGLRVRFRYARSNSAGSIFSSSAAMISSVTVCPSAGSVARHVAGSSRGMSSGAYHSKYAVRGRAACGSSASAAHNASISARPFSRFLFSHVDFVVPPADAHHSCAIARVSIAGENACSNRSSSCANASSMNPRSNGGPCPAFSVFAVMPIFERVDGHRIASLPFDFRIRARFARSEPLIFSQNSSSHRCRAMPRVCAA